MHSLEKSPCAFQCLDPGASRWGHKQPSYVAKAPRRWVDLCLSRLEVALRFSSLHVCKYTEREYDGLKGPDCR